MSIPNFTNLPTHCLAGVFKKRTNSYKFYWFLSILDFIGKKKKISFNELAITMIANAWYPINYSRISFGKTDKLSNAVLKLKKQLHIPDNAEKEDIFKTLKQNIKLKEVHKEVKHFLNYVPYRFLSPWCSLYDIKFTSSNESKNKKMLQPKCDKYFSNTEFAPLYRFTPNFDYIIIQDDWYNYFEKHLSILKEFCLWNLLTYLQSRNPNVPNIADKLFPPKTRKLGKAKKFWKYAVEKQAFSCIYSAKTISSTDKYSIDHFVPWRFVTHDLIWNLIPTPKNVNSSKSDKLPDLDTYLDNFIQMHKTAFDLHYINKKDKEKQLAILDDYFIIFDDAFTYETIHKMEMPIFTKYYKKQITPLIQIAKNIGFQPNWTYTK